MSNPFDRVRRVLGSTPMRLFMVWGFTCILNVFLFMVLAMNPVDNPMQPHFPEGTGLVAVIGVGVFMWFLMISESYFFPRNFGIDDHPTSKYLFYLAAVILSNAICIFITMIVSSAYPEFRHEFIFFNGVFAGLTIPTMVVLGVFTWYRNNRQVKLSLVK